MEKKKYSKDYFTKEEKELIIRIVDRTWSTIGSDILVDDRGRPDYNKTVSASEMVEISLDADHWETYGGGIREIFHPLIEKLWELDSKEMKKAISDLFPYKTYGW